MDVVGFMAAYCNPMCVRVCVCVLTDTIEPFFVILAKYCTRLPDDGSSVIRNMLEYF